MKFFKLKTLELDLEKRLLTINGKSVSTDDITDFSLSTRDDGSWSITAKKNLLMEFFEECPKKNSEGKPTPGNRVRVLREQAGMTQAAVSYTHLRAHETKAKLVCRLLLEKKKKRTNTGQLFMETSRYKYLTYIHSSRYE